MDGYEMTGNTEYLVDIANYCLLAFLEDEHPNKHFSAMDENEGHAVLVSRRMAGPIT